MGALASRHRLPAERRRRGALGDALAADGGGRCAHRARHVADREGVGALRGAGVADRCGVVALRLRRLADREAEVALGLGDVAEGMRAFAGRHRLPAEGGRRGARRPCSRRRPRSSSCPSRARRCRPRARPSPVASAFLPIGDRAGRGQAVEPGHVLALAPGSGVVADGDAVGGEGPRAVAVLVGVAAERERPGAARLGLRAERHRGDARPPARRWPCRWCRRRSRPRRPQRRSPFRRPRPRPCRRRWRDGRAPSRARRPRVLLQPKALAPGACASLSPPTAVVDLPIASADLPTASASDALGLRVVADRGGALPLGHRAACPARRR